MALLQPLISRRYRVGAVRPRESEQVIRPLVGQLARVVAFKVRHLAHPLALFVAAMACFVVAAFLVSVVLGFVTAGVALLLSEYRVGE